MKILVRRGELACRNSWGGDFWADAPTSDAVDATATTVTAAPITMAPPVREPTPAPLAATAGDPAPPTEADAEDMTINPAARRDQDERAAAIRLGTRDAIRLARERSAGRRSGTRSPVPIDDADDAEDRVVLQTPAPVIPTDSNAGAPHDLVVGQAARQPATPAGTNDPVDPVPTSELAGRSGHIAEDKYHTVPEIRPDVALPRLREQFRLPASPAGKPAAPDDEDGGMSRYDRVLQRAMAYRRAADGTGDEPAANDSPPATTPRASHEAPPVAAEAPPDDPDPLPEPNDEVVAFQVDRRAGLRRPPTTAPQPFDDPLDNVADDGDDAAIDDYELDRSYRPEPPALQQTGWRWWQQARDRVFGHGQPSPTGFSLDDPVSEDAAWEAPATEGGLPDGEIGEPAPAAVADLLAACRIEWDNPTLAPKPRPAIAASGDSADTPTLPDRSLPPLPDFGDEAEVGDEAPALWETPARNEAAWPAAPQAEREEDTAWDEPAASPSLYDQAFALDLTQPSGMASLRERLFGQATTAARTPMPANSPVHDAPATPPPSVPHATSANADDWPQDRADVVLAAEPRLDTIDEPVPVERREPEISPGIPRQCATCRSFRPSEDGQRGWCTNRWAFPHQPQVNAEDLACKSSMGAWWLPIDEGWDTDSLRFRLAQRTPRTDQLEAALHGPPPERRKSG